MALDNLPLFSAMNREEVKPPFPQPQRPMTSQESHFAIMEKVNACINEVNMFEHRVHHELKKYFTETDTENQAFKEAIQSSYNAFMGVIQKEVNNFETSMQNNFDIYRNDVDKRIADFQTAINNEVTTFLSEINKAFEEIKTKADNKLVELNAFQESLNTSFADFQQEMNVKFTQHKNECATLYNNFVSNVNTKMGEQDETIADAKRYMEVNLQATVRKIFDESVKDGTITNIMQNIFGADNTFKGANTSTNILAISDATIGDYWFATDTETYYQYSVSGWVNVGTNSKIANEVINARMNKKGETFGSLKDAIHGAVIPFTKSENLYDILATTNDIIRFGSQYTFSNNGEVATITGNVTGKDQGMKIKKSMKFNEKYPITIDFNVIDMVGEFYTLIWAYLEDGTRVSNSINLEYFPVKGENVIHYDLTELFPNDYENIVKLEFFINCNSVNTDTSISVSDFKIYQNIVKDVKFVGENLAETLLLLNGLIEEINVEMKNVFYAPVVLATTKDAYGVYGGIISYDEETDTIALTQEESTSDYSNAGIRVAFNIDENYVYDKPLSISADIVNNLPMLTYVWGYDVEGNNIFMINGFNKYDTGKLEIDIPVNEYVSKEDFKKVAKLWVTLNKKSTFSTINATISNLKITQKVKSSIIDTNLEKTFENLEKYLHEITTPEKIVNKLIFAHDIWTNWIAQIISITDEHLYFKHEKETGNSGIITHILDERVNVGEGVEIEFDVDSVEGYVNLSLAFTNTSGTTNYVTIAKDIQVGKHTYFVDLPYYAVYQNASKDYRLLIHNRTGIAEITLSNVKVKQSYFSNNKDMVGETLFDTINNICNALNTGSSISGSSLLVAPNGDKYTPQINNDGSLTYVPVVPDNVLFIGNSLLLGHQTFGMCATSSDTDYYHYVKTEIENQKGVEITTERLGGSTWEGLTTYENQNSWLENTLKPYLNENIKLVLIQLSDNVNTDEKNAVFSEGCLNFLKFVRENAQNSRVAWVGAWYTNTTKIAQMKNACEKTGSIFINISDLKTSENCGAIGDVIIDDNENTTTYTINSFTDNGDNTLTINFTVNNTIYTTTINVSSYTDNGDNTLTVTGYEHIVVNGGVASHPSSKGMLAIANRICYTLGITDDETTITE